MQALLPIQPQKLEIGPWNKAMWKRQNNVTHNYLIVTHDYLIMTHDYLIVTHDYLISCKSWEGKQELPRSFTIYESFANPARK